MVFAPEKKTYSETRKRTSSAYVKFTPDFRVTLRVLDNNAVLVWKHFIQEANAGKGMGAVCPNINAQTKVCPIEKSLEGLDRDNPEVIERRAKKRYVVNVLDRTPYTTCNECGTETPGKNCISCGEDLKKNVFAPLNKMKILEGGPMLFLQGLNPVEQIGLEDWGVDITNYDITFQTKGSGRDKKTTPVPQTPQFEEDAAGNKHVVPLPDEAFIDPETGERQKLFDLTLLAEPTPVEEIELMLKGATMQDLNDLRGIA